MKCSNQNYAYSVLFVVNNILIPPTYAAKVTKWLECSEEKSYSTCRRQGCIYRCTATLYCCYPIGHCIMAANEPLNVLARSRLYSSKEATLTRVTIINVANSVANAGGSKSFHYQNFDYPNT